MQFQICLMHFHWDKLYRYLSNVVCQTQITEKEHTFIFCVSIPQKTIPVFQKSGIRKSYSEKVNFLYSVRVFQKEPSPYSKKAYAICFYSEKAKILYSGQIFRKSQISIPKKTFFRVLACVSTVSRK